MFTKENIPQIQLAVSLVIAIILIPLYIKQHRIANNQIAKIDLEKQSATT
jgi:hypothetical protein